MLRPRHPLKVHSPKAIFAALIIFAGLLGPASAQESVTSREPSEAVILMYHRFGASDSPGTTIRPDQFAGHLQELTSGDYRVLPLAAIVAAMREKRALPRRSVAITLDEADISVYREAWPRLKAAGLPFTLFVTPAVIDAKAPGAMTWEQIRELERAGTTIGHHGQDAASLMGRTPEDVAQTLQAANARFLAELGQVPRLFAYPQGEFDLSLKDAIEAAGFDAAFAQYSGVGGSFAPLFAQPRFGFSENYASLGRFRLIATARALPATDVTPSNPRLGPNNPPAFGFTVNGLANLQSLSCFPSHLTAPATLDIVGESRVEVRFATPFPPGRWRINCTMSSPGGRWHWFGRPFFVDQP